MNLDDIPDGSVCVIDTNVLIYAEQGLSLQAQRLLRRIEERNLSGILPQPVWQETMHRLMVTEAIMLGHVRGPNPTKQLAAKPEVIKELSLYKDKIRALVTLGLAFKECEEKDLLTRAIQIQEEYGLLTNDSLIIAMSMRLAVDAVASADTRFRAIKEIKTYIPSDVTLITGS